MIEPLENEGLPQQFSHAPDLLSREMGQRTFWIAAMAIIGVVVGALCLQIAGPEGGLVWLSFFGLSVALLFLLARYFELGIVAFIGVCWIAIGTPTLAQGGSGGGAQALKISHVGLLVLLGLWGIRRFFQLRRGAENNGLYKTPVNLPILLYLTFSIWSTLNSFLFPNADVLANGPKQFVQVNILEILMHVLSLGGLLMIADTLRGKALAAACVAIVLPGIVTFTGILPFLPPSSYLAFPQVLAMAILAAVALGGESWASKWVRALCGALALAILYTYFVKGAEWVSGWLGALVALAIVTYTAQRRLFWAACGLIALVVLVNFPYFYASVYTSNFYGNGPTHDIARVGHMGTFTNDRTRMWGAAFRYATNFPLGIGLGNYRSYNQYFGRVDVWNTTTFTSAHGTYSQALSETGFAGFFTLLWLIYASSLMLKTYYKSLPGGWEKTYLLGAWGGCVGVFCASFNGDYLFPTYHNGGMGSFGACVYTWMLIGVCMALARERGLIWSEIAPKRPPEQIPKVVGPMYNHGPYAEKGALTDNKAPSA